MATWTCRECTTAYAVGLPACPNCRSTDHEETGMAKISRLRGPSNARDPQPEPAAAPAVDEAVKPVSADTAKGGEESSPGTSSSASTRKTAASSKKSAAPRRQRARMTASPSSPGPEGSSTASGGITSGPATGESSDAG